MQKHHYLLNTLLIRRGRSGQWAGINHSDDEMLYLMYYALLRLEKDPDRRRILLQSIARTWEGAPGEQSVRAARPCTTHLWGDHGPALRRRGGGPDATGLAVGPDRVDGPQQSPPRRAATDDAAWQPCPRELDRVLPASERRLAHWNGNPWAADGGTAASARTTGRPGRWLTGSGCITAS